MSEYENLSHAELIKMLEKKDNDIENLQEKLNDFYVSIFSKTSLDEVSINSPDNFSFSELVISDDEHDNSREVSSAESVFSNNSSQVTQLNSEILSQRKIRLEEAVEHYKSLHTSDVDVGLDNIKELSELDYENYEYAHKILAKLVGHTSNYELNLYFGTAKCLNIFSAAAKDIKEDNPKIPFIETFIEHFLSDSVKHKRFADNEFMDYSAKLSFLNNYFKQSLVTSISVRKEQHFLKESLEPVIKNNINQNRI